MRDPAIKLWDENEQPYRAFLDSKTMTVTLEDLTSDSKTLYTVGKLLAGYDSNDGHLNCKLTLWLLNLAYDFGNGYVLAHRHVNPDGSIGGWVANTAVVGSNVNISFDAEVFDNAILSNNVTLSDNAKVYGQALISGNAKIGGNATVSGKAVVDGEADISGNHEINGFTHISS